MRLSIAYTGFVGLESTMPAILAAEEAGLDGVWVAEHIGYHDAIVHATMILRATQRLKVGVVGLSTAGRHPGITAMELLSLSEIAPGRVRAAVGTGDPKLVASLGKPLQKPLGANQAFVEALRETMKGSTMMVQRPEFSFRGFRANPFGKPIPIDLMAIRPKMLRLAARVGDGLSISVGASRQYIRDAVAIIEDELAACGRDRKDFHISALALGIVADDIEPALGPIKALMAMAEQDMVEHLARGVFEPGTLTAAESEGMMAVMKAWTPEKIEGTTLACSPEALPEKLAAYADTGIDELSLVLAGDMESHPDIVRTLAAAHRKL